MSDKLYCDKCGTILTSVGYCWQCHSHPYGKKVIYTSDSRTYEEKDNESNKV
jgi:hypothetical protein